jgi:hypothetical protein
MGQQAGVLRDGVFRAGWGRLGPGAGEMSGTGRVRGLLLVVILWTVVGMPDFGPAGTRAAQDAAPVDFDPAACEPADTAPAFPTPSATPGAVSAAFWDFTQGTPADSFLAQELVRDLIAPFMACANAGDAGGMALLATETFWQRHPPPSDLPEPPAEADWLTFTILEDVRIHEGDVATVFLTVQDPTWCETGFVIAVVARRVEGAWLIDDLARIDGLTPLRWDPPILRPEGTPRCDEAPGTPIAFIRPLMANRQEPELQTRTSQSVIDELLAREGVILLENVEVRGALDLRGVPSNRLIARNVVFNDGIDVSLPVDVRGVEAADRPGMNFYFKETVFGGPVNFRLDRFDQLECSDCTFREIFDASSARAQNMFFRGSRFESAALFSYVEVAGVLDVSSSHFAGFADFTGASFDELRMTLLSTSQPIQIRWGDFGDHWLDQRLREALAASPADQRWLFNQLDLDLRFWQQNFNALGQGRDAREVYQVRVELQKDYFLDWNDWEKWEALVKGAGTGYGTEPYRALLIVLVIVCWFTVVYRLNDPFVRAEGSSQDAAIDRWNKTLFAFLYSVDAFVPFAIVTGAKDSGWVIRGRRRWAVIVERIIGSFATILLAYNVGAYLL